MAKYKWSESEAKRREERRPDKIHAKPVKKPTPKDAKLWKVFSMYIRLRDADNNGVCKCFTCGRLTIWNKNTDCGHGIGRQHKGTKYNEKNNHAQCKKCNGFEGGMRERYKEEMNKRYGANTWDLMEASAKRVCHIGQFEIDTMTKMYQLLVAELLTEKCLNGKTQTAKRA